MKTNNKNSNNNSAYYFLNIKNNSVLPNPEIVYSTIIKDEYSIDTIQEYADNSPNNSIILRFDKPNSRRHSLKINKSQTKPYFNICFFAEVISARPAEFGGIVCLFRLKDYFEYENEISDRTISKTEIDKIKTYSTLITEHLATLSDEVRVNCANLLQKNLDLLYSLDLDFADPVFENTINNDNSEEKKYISFFNIVLPYLCLTDDAYDVYMSDYDVLRKLEFIDSVLNKRLMLNKITKSNADKATKIISTYKDVNNQWVKELKKQEKVNSSLKPNDVKSAHKFIISAQGFTPDGAPLPDEMASDFFNALESLNSGDFTFLNPMLSSKKTKSKKNGKETFYEKYSREHKFSEKTKKYVDFVNSLEASNEVKEEIASEIHKIESTANTFTSEYGTSLDYLETCTKVPFNKLSETDFDIEKAKKIIEDSHFGMKDVKKRINEFLTIHKLSGSENGAIICLVGPPGVGKTSIAKSIATALNRQYYRFSVGGVSDEAEFIGHRRTYVAAQPGKIIQGLSKTKVMNPVFLIDEIDKISQSTRKGGDPLGTLLNILDPEQNKNFTDLYLNFPIDLSKVIFILTANDISSLPLPLLDRMEIIEVDSYTTDEKVEIFKQYLTKRCIDELKINKEIDCNNITNADIVNLIDSYTHEAGVRGLKQQLEKLMRAEIEVQYDANDKITIDLSKEALRKYLGVNKFDRDDNIEINNPGTSIGLAWTAVGGATLKIETIEVNDGKGELKLTGQLGDVMKESADIAFTYLKHLVNDKDNYFSKNNFHLHIPEGATPKDGPSAGITMLTAFYSLYTKKKVKSGLAMTGELTLNGDVMPIGGLKEKLYAAKSNNIKEVLIPFKNKKNLEEIDDKIKNNLEIKFVKKADEVLKYAFEEV